MASAAPKLTTGLFTAVPSPSHRRNPPPHHHLQPLIFKKPTATTISAHRRIIVMCKATDVSSSSSPVAKEEPGPLSAGNTNWVPVVPLSALPKGERRVIIQDEETILLLWYKDDVFAIENRSPAEGAYSEGLLNAKLTQVNSLPSNLSIVILNVDPILNIVLEQFDYSKIQGRVRFQDWCSLTSQS
ncbi:Rieske [2Fe-2S] iron-sulfur domain-containing [Olea europaea subsp. europaea]|uniref:Rieske [2Fe-2S] iron-sulfur domain-containing n=2 Tax=Olea europaea subsp. europaea TaxID=158383 RepID=A0A8S0TBJ4_OLEEU|nr:Rieske [2Fe-2S] iron-sulfur domain-containing [Olea europaea subsp. europaea]